MSPTLRKTLEAVRDWPQATAQLLAHVWWPHSRAKATRPIAEGRLRAAARAGYLHARFEPGYLKSRPETLSDVNRRRPVYELSALGRDAICARPAE